MGVQGQAQFAALFAQRRRAVQRHTEQVLAAEQAVAEGGAARLVGDRLAGGGQGIAAVVAQTGLTDAGVLQQAFHHPAGHAAVAVEQRLAGRFAEHGEDLCAVALNVLADLLHLMGDLHQARQQADQQGGPQGQGEQAV